MRIVSLLPSTTEILFAIGAGPDVVGVTFECDHPAEARSRTIVSTSAMPAGLPPAEIDAFVTRAMQAGEDLYHLDEGALSGLDADLVVTQDLCAVCAVDVTVVDDALAHLGCTAEVLTIDPHTLDEVFASILTLGRATGPGRGGRGAGRVAAGPAGRRPGAGRRPAPAAGDAAGVDRPAVRARALGAGDDRGGRGRAAARARPARSPCAPPGRRCRAAGPDLVVAAPCGYDLAGATALAGELVASGVLPPGVPVHPVDANAAWARPGTRLVDGVEELAALLHPGPRLRPLSRRPRSRGRRTSRRGRRAGRAAGPREPR